MFFYTEISIIESRSVYHKPYKTIMSNIKHTLKNITRRFATSFRTGRGWHDVKVFFGFCGFYARRCLDAFYEYSDVLSNIEGDSYKKLKKTAQGLHLLLAQQQTDPLSFSILVPIFHYHPKLTEKSLRSLAELTSPDFEVLLYIDSSVQFLLDPLLATLKKDFPGKFIEVKEKLKANENVRVQAYNVLAEQAKKKFLFFMQEFDVLRPDTLLRFEQTLLLSKEPNLTLLYAEELQMASQGFLKPSPHQKFKNHFAFPYCFQNPLQHHFLISKSMWKKLEGFNLKVADCAFFDFVLKACHAGCQIEHLPFPLYFCSENHVQKDPYDSSQQFQVFSDHVKRNGLDWEVKEEGLPSQVRLLPRLSARPNVQIIIPFKDQKNLTLKAVRSALNQVGVNVGITAVDNESSDKSIAADLEKLGVEVLRITEPFNYSRLNNLAVIQTHAHADKEYVLFMNNDVELEANSLLEMCRWAFQPSVGMVGCKLLYPDGKIQHAGIRLALQAPTHQMMWQHVDLRKFPAEAKQSQQIEICDAVTAACALISRKTFLEVGGFDETWYPIAYSDTNLAIKVRNKGLHCLYTPYAQGIHYESQSRTNSNIEDFERSKWLHERLLKIDSKSGEKNIKD